MGTTFFFLVVFALISPIFFLLPKKYLQPVLGLYSIFLIFLAFGDLLFGPLLEEAAITAYLHKFNLPPQVVHTHPYAKIAAFGFTAVGALALLYGMEVSKNSEKIISFYALAGAVGILYANHFILFYAFWEMLTISAACLILVHRTPEAIQKGYRFLLFQLSGGLFLFMGILQHYNATGSLEVGLPEAGLPLFVVGIGVKTAFIPLHFWLPWGYPSASFSSSVLLSILTTKVGVYAVARILPPLDFIAFMGALMAVFGICMAILQTDLRRLLSYHIISQVGYMVAGAGLGTYLGVDGGLLHLVNHMLYKALLFMSAGALIYAAGSEDLHKLQGTGEDGGKKSPGKVIPLALTAAVAGSLAIAGTPLFNGYVSKYLLKYATEGTGAVEWMLLIASAGTALSFSKFVYFGFVRSRINPARSLPVSLQAAMGVGAAGCLLLGIWPGILAPILPHASSLEVYSAAGISGASIPLIAGILLFLLLKNILDPAHEHKIDIVSRIGFLKVLLSAGSRAAANIKLVGLVAGYIEEINTAQLFISICLAYLLLVMFSFYFFI